MNRTKDVIDQMNYFANFGSDKGWVDTLSNSAANHLDQ